MGIFSPRFSAMRILPRAATAGDMSSTKGASFPPGAPAASGLVPRRASRPPQGGIAREAVRVHAAQIGAHEAGGDGRCVLLRHAVRDEQHPREGVGLVVLDVYAFAHRSAISCTCFAR